ncbi:hypothetical protein HMPREF1548_03388 [Clostridium sp. KLE 1755]|nr:hypothetical protein HMPREF1548_03388 [Clostridium sp. KLE 1755]
MCAPGRPAMIRAGQSQTGSVQAFPGCAGDILCSRLKKRGVFNCPGTSGFCQCN